MRRENLEIKFFGKTVMRRSLQQNTWLPSQSHFHDNNKRASKRLSPRNRTRRNPTCVFFLKAKQWARSLLIFQSLAQSSGPWKKHLRPDPADMGRTACRAERAPSASHPPLPSPDDECSTVQSHLASGTCLLSLSNRHPNYCLWSGNIVLLSSEATNCLRKSTHPSGPRKSFNYCGRVGFLHFLMALEQKEEFFAHLNRCSLWGQTPCIG